jgi:hypothetical protein
MTLFAGRGYEVALHHLYDQEFDQLRWSYPLHSLFFFAPFAALPYTEALVLWITLGIAAFLGTAALALPKANRKHALLFLACSPIMLVELLTRQNGFFIGAAALGVLLLLQHNRPVLAGILLGCLTIKPQLFILWPIMLLIDRQWRCIAAAGITTLLLLGTSLLVHGVAAWEMFLQVVPNCQWQLVHHPAVFETRMLYQLMMPGVMPGLRILGMPDTIVIAAQILLSVAVLVGTILVLFKPIDLAQRVFILSCGSLLFTPYAFNYDMTLLTLALTLLWASAPQFGRSHFILGGILYVMPLMVYILNLIDLPIASVFLGLAFFGMVREVLRQPPAKVTS